MKKVISFCLYGSNDLYCLGLIENIDIINEKYNDWQIYVYYNNIPDKILNILKNKSNTYLFDCTHNGYKWEGTFWRFYPIESNDIDIFLSRDTDSRITDREINLVNSWIQSNKAFHIIRDHPGHGIPILAGTFGVDIKQFKKLINNINFKSINEYITMYYNIYDKDSEKHVDSQFNGVDQVFLCNLVYPIIKDHNMAHIVCDSLRHSPNDILIGSNYSNHVGMVITPTINI